MERPTRDFERTSDAFIRQVAHDLRASLNVVVSWAELVKAGQLPPEDVSRAGDTIVRHARHLSERLGVALDLWRLDSGLLDRRRCVSPDRRDRACRGRRRAPAFRQPSRDLPDRRARRWTGQRGRAPACPGARVLLGDAAAEHAGRSARGRHAVDADGGQVIVRIVGGGLMPAQIAFNRDLADTRATGPETPVRLRAVPGQGARRAQRGLARRRAGRGRPRGHARAAAGRPSPAIATIGSPDSHWLEFCLISSVTSPAANAPRCGYFDQCGRLLDRSTRWFRSAKCSFKPAIAAGLAPRRRERPSLRLGGRGVGSGYASARMGISDGGACDQAHEARFQPRAGSGRPSGAGGRRRARTRPVAEMPARAAAASPLKPVRPSLMPSRCWCRSTTISS